MRCTFASKTVFPLFRRAKITLDLDSLFGMLAIQLLNNSNSCSRPTNKLGSPIFYHLFENILETNHV
ncbi:hypothetical protein [Candidatus Marithrix sp. Canyon 246]|uniref:hypothetical protein n=1 Tax=Candidatus Marithrix sp. Canyon 246 TaxID=1827136 RepID=UPI000849FB71|nr:hypothetical protein [Candidatus Marithrix sp. Canyon 246]